jgi:hypothetical protein
MILRVQLLKGCSVNLVCADYHVPDDYAEEFFKKLHKHIKRHTDNLVAKKEQKEEESK